MPPTGFGTGQTVLTIRYLLRLTSFVDSSDVSGSQEIEKVCQVMMSDIMLNDCLVDPVLSAWFRGVNVAFGQVVLTNVLRISTIADGDSEETQAMKKVRAMEMIAWMLTKYSNGNQGMAKDSTEFIQEVLPIIFSSMQTPIVELRELAVRCLGLSSIASESSDDTNREIIMQVCQAEGEDDLVRGQALQALFDMAVVFPAKFSNDPALTHVLLRILESGNSYLVSIASEGCSKLLFTGVLAEPRLFAQLLKLFLIMEQPSEEEETDDGMIFSSLGSNTHMQQVLSVFFHAFFVAGNGREIIALESIADLVGDVASMIRYGDMNGTVLLKVRETFVVF